MTTRVPAHLVHECTACGRPYASGSTMERAKAKGWDTTNVWAGSKGLCQRDKDRLAAHARLATKTTRAEVIAEEADFLGVRETARAYGIKPESVQRAICRARRYQASRDGAAA